MERRRVCQQYNFHKGLVCLFIWIKTPSFIKNGEHEVVCDCDECFIALQDVALLLYLRLNYSPERVIK